MANCLPVSRARYALAADVGLSVRRPSVRSLSIPWPYLEN